MFTQSVTQHIRWQDFSVRNEVDIILEIAQLKGWKDCEIFGHGSMISQPQESKGWKLLPADQYEYSIPAEGVSRVHQIINAGVRIQGVIIADDVRRAAPAPARHKFSLPSIDTVVTFLDKTLAGLFWVAVAIGIVGLVAAAIIKFPALLLFAPLLLIGASMEFDPKLILLVSDGNGATVWVSVFTWYE